MLLLCHALRNGGHRSRRWSKQKVFISTKRSNEKKQDHRGSKLGVPNTTNVPGSDRVDVNSRTVQHRTGKRFYAKTNEGAKEEAAGVNYTMAGTGGNTYT